MAKQTDIKSMQVEVNSGQTSGAGSITLDKDSKLYGIHLFLPDTVFGDVGKVEILDSDDNTIRTYGPVDLPLVDKVFIQGDLTMPGDLVAGLKIKFSYTAADTNGRKCIVWVQIIF